MAGDMTRTDVFKYQKTDVGEEVIIVFAVVFLIMLACVAGVQKGKGKGEFGGEIPSPSPFERLSHRLLSAIQKIVVL